MKTCDAPDCDRQARSNRAPWCDVHRQRIRNTGRLDLVERIGNDGPCSVQECAKPARCRQMCAMHYERWRKYGDPLMAVQPQGPAVDRFWAKVVKTDSCWNWTGSTTSGYGNMNLGHNRYGYTHRFSYELVHGPIPDGLTLDHLCKNTRCCNPDHLEAVTMAENGRRANRIGHDHENAPTTCKRGHDWSITPPYLAHRSRGRATRRCRVCQSDRDKAKRLRSNPFRCDETDCRRRARWFVVSGPMFVCWQHKLHYEAQGEQTAELIGAVA